MNLGIGGCSEPRSSNCTPVYVTERDSVSKGKKKGIRAFKSTQVFWGIENALERTHFHKRPGEALIFSFASSFDLVKRKRKAKAEF